MKTLFFKTLLILLIVLKSSISIAQVQMQGIVMNMQGNELVGALVMVENTSIATLTNTEGYFSIYVPEEYINNRVIINYVGYLKLPVSVHTGWAPYTMQARQSRYIEQKQISTQMRAQREVDVPIAVSAIDEDRLRNNDLNQIDEIARFVPGCSMLMADHSNATYGIRGLSSDGVESYFQQRVAIFLDGISIGRIQTSVFEPLDLKSVEVAKGPQGTLFGRGAESGAISYIRNKPVKDTFDFSAMCKYGTYNQRTLEAMLNTPLAPNISNRFAVRFNTHDGYMENLDGGKLNGEKTMALKEAFSIFINDRQTLTFTGDMLDEDSPGACLKTNRVGTDSWSDDKSPFTAAYLNGDSLGLKRRVYNGIIQYDCKIGNNWNFSNTLGARYYYNELRYDSDGSYLPILNGLDRVSGNQVSEEARFTWKTGSDEDYDEDIAPKWSGFFGLSYVREDNTHKYNLVSDLRYMYPVVIGPKIRKALNSFPKLIADSFEQVITQMEDQLSQSRPESEEIIRDYLESYKPMARDLIESNVSKLYDDLYLNCDFWQKTPDIVSQTADLCNSVLTEVITQIVESNEMFKGFLEQGMGGGIEGFVKNIDIYGMLDNTLILKSISNIDLPWDAHEDMIDRCITNEAGLFADATWNFAKDFYLTVGARATYETMETSYVSNSPNAPYINQPLLFMSSNGETLWSSINAASWVGRLIVNWKFDPTHNIYASASKGRRPGCVYYDLSPSKLDTLNAETLYNYELGIKGISKYGDFQYYAAFYYYDYINCQSSAYRIMKDGTRGLETSDEGKARGYGFDGSLLYTFSNQNYSVFLDYAYCHGRFCDKDANGNDQELAGNRFRLNPEHTVDLGLNYHKYFGKDMKNMVFFYPSIATTGRMYFSDNNRSELMQDAYTLFNCNLGYRRLVDIKNATYNFDFVLYGKNITNAKYLVDAGNTGDGFGYPTFVAGAPATFGLSVRISRNTDKKEAEWEGVYYR